MSIDVYVERGAKRTFVSAVEWPGWARSGRDEASALEALLVSAPRYAKVVASTGLGFRSPDSISDLRVVQRLPGNATTDFGAPAAVPTADTAAVRADDLKRIETLIEVTWRAFDAAVTAAKGKTLAKGPRGGGRALEKIAEHVREAERGYLSALGWGNDARDVAGVHKAVIDGFRASARGEIPPTGPRGGKRSMPRQFARRLAWHAIDHAWEIEDRAGGVTSRRAPARPTRASAPAPRAPTPRRARR
ncbi:MAG: hypothetical protein E6J52_12055 [Chloroflexi bacterium]|nr:MAG: hypothetical protein E6J52_12055 [Chloroflexota bacterium]